MRDRVLATLTEFVAARPEVADMVARQFVLRYDYGMAEPLRRLLESGRIDSARVLIPVSTYVATATAGLVPGSELE